MTPQEIAEKSVAIMWDSDTASAWAGMRLDVAGPGTATVSMTLEPHHCNGHGTAHGGVLYMLAGTAFAMAINSRNQRAVAQGAEINYLAPGHVGDRLTAQAVEKSKTGRTGVCDVTIRNRSDQVVAEFRGTSRDIKGTLF